MAATPVSRRSFRSAPESMSAVRRFVRDALDGHERCDDAVLVACELATNAFQHTSTREFTVTAYRDIESVTIIVSADPGEGATRPQMFDGVFGRDGGEDGRGLRVVNELAAQWGCGELNGRQSVYAILNAQAPVPSLAAPVVAMAE